MPFLSISIGELFFSSDFQWLQLLNGFYASDWIKLYLGKKNGAHVLGCAYPSSRETGCPFTNAMEN